MTAKSSKASFTVSAPKKASSAYNLWMADERLKKKESNQQLSFSEYAQLWKEVAESKKQQYQVLAAKDKERFDREMVDFKQSPNYAVFLQEKKSKVEADKQAALNKAKKRKSVPKDPNAPKKISGFILFSNEARPAVKTKNPSATFAEISKIISTQWNALGEGEKQKYKDRAGAMSSGASSAPASKATASISKATTSAQPSSASKKKAVEPVPRPEPEEEDDEEEEEDDETAEVEYEHEDEEDEEEEDTEEDDE